MPRGVSASERNHSETLRRQHGQLPRTGCRLHALLAGSQAGGTAQDYEHAGHCLR